MSIQMIYATFILQSLIIFSERPAISASELTPQNLADANQASISSISAMKATVKTKFRTSAPELAALDQELFYVRSGQQERVSIQLTHPRVLTGEFTGLPFPLGNKQIHNGPSGYRILSNSNDLRDEFGNFPVDSPSHGIDELPKSSLGYHVTKYYLGLEVLAGASEVYGLGHLIQNSTKTDIIEKPSINNRNCFCIQFEFAGCRHRIWLSRDHAFMIRRMEFVDSSGTITDFRVIDFQQHGEIYLPINWTLSRRENGLQEVVLEGEIEVHSINSPIAESELFVQYPEGLPFFDKKLNQAGVWGDDEAAMMFSSKNEALDWFNKRKQDYVKGRAPRTWGPQVFVVSCILAVLFLGFFWFTGKPKARGFR